MDFVHNSSLSLKVYGSMFEVTLLALFMWPAIFLERHGFPKVYIYIYRNFRKKHFENRLFMFGMKEKLRYCVDWSWISHFGDAISR